MHACWLNLSCIDCNGGGGGFTNEATAASTALFLPDFTDPVLLFDIAANPPPLPSPHQPLNRVKGNFIIFL